MTSAKLSTPATAATLPPPVGVARRSLADPDPCRDRSGVDRPSTDELARERDDYRATLERIAGAQSGHWGQVAHEALRRWEKNR